MRASVLRPTTEKEFQAQVLQAARLLGWRAYHTFDSRRSTAGFPDLVLVRERLVVAELKAQAGGLSADQKGWLTVLELAGVECYVWRPADWSEVVRVLERRRRPGRG